MCLPYDYEPLRNGYLSFPPLHRGFILLWFPDFSFLIFENSGTLHLQHSCFTCNEFFLNSRKMSVVSFNPPLSTFVINCFCVFLRSKGWLSVVATSNLIIWSPRKSFHCFWTTRKSKRNVSWLTIAELLRAVNESTVLHKNVQNLLNLQLDLSSNFNTVCYPPSIPWAWASTLVYKLWRLK